VVAGVRTDQGDVEAEVVVNCAGQWAKQVGAMCAVTVPLHSAEHFYVVTGQIDGVNRDLPILRDPDGYTYIKEEVGGLLVGGFEPEAKPWVAPDQLPLSRLAFALAGPGFDDSKVTSRADRNFFPG
jgi:glycine/D-amino acid oxidase-like deaminating enzyme